MAHFYAPATIGAYTYFAPDIPPGGSQFIPQFYRSIIMRASPTDITAAQTATPVYGIGDPNSLEILLTRPDNSTAALYPSIGTTPLVTVDQGTFAAYQYSVYNFSITDITMAGKYHMRHVYTDSSGSIVSNVSSFTVA